MSEYRVYKPEKGDLFDLNSKYHICGEVEIGTKLYLNTNDSRFFTYGNDSDECARVIEKVTFKVKLTNFIRNIKFYIIIPEYRIAVKLKHIIKNLFIKRYIVEWTK